MQMHFKDHTLTALCTMSSIFTWHLHQVGSYFWNTGT